MIDQELTTPPAAPNSNDIPTFRTRFDAFIAWIVTFVTQLTTVISQINSTASTINDKEISAVSSAQVAVSATNFQGTWTNQTTQVGQSWLFGGVVYMVLIPGNTSPTVSPSNWMALPKVKTVNGFSIDATGNINVEGRIGTPIASASTITIGTAGLGDYSHITGVVPITSLGTAATVGIRRTLIFDSAGCVLTHSSNIICPSAVSITSVAGTVIEVIAETTNIWRVVSIFHPSISHAELGYLDGVTSAIQTQLNTIINSSFGVGQTQQDLTGSMYSGSAYTNSTSKTRIVMVEATSGGGGAQLTPSVGGVTLPSSGGASVSKAFVSFPVQAGASYSVTANLGTITKWIEFK